MSRVIRVQPPRRPNTDLVDTQIGFVWWNRLTLDQRTAWLERAASPTECWRAYKRGICLEAVRP